MHKRIIWVRLAYWAGIIADLVVALYMLFPQWDSRLFGAKIVSSPIFGLGIRRGAALMIGWTVLLFWADRKPIERRDVLLITICPVMIGSLAYLGYAWLSGLTSPSVAVSNLIIEAVFIIIFAVGYLNARQLHDRQANSS